MPSTLPQSTFDALFIYNGPWGPTANPVGVIGTNRLGTDGNDDLTYNNLVSALLANGGAGNDRITITNALGLNLLVNGGEGNDQIFGSNGVDNINGGNGNDYIVGGGGLDTLNGGAGIDTLSYETATSRGGTGGIAVGLGPSGNVVLLNPGDTDIGRDRVTGGFENVVGTNFRDRIDGNTFDNILIGLDGNDHLSGSDGKDSLWGSAGDDRLEGEGRIPGGTVGKDDILIGGPGADVMVGGGVDPQSGRPSLLGGNDTFRFLTKADLIGDSIDDFSSGDKLDFSAIDPDNNPDNGNGTFDPGQFEITALGGQQFTVKFVDQAGVITVVKLDAGPLTTADFTL
jgi:Ca2+-binding RTX toxin-like protein